MRLLAATPLSIKICICPRFGLAIARDLSLPVPETVTRPSKPALAVQMVQRALATEVPFSWVAVDAVYGVGVAELALRRACWGHVLGIKSSHRSAPANLTSLVRPRRSQEASNPHCHIGVAGPAQRRYHKRMSRQPRSRDADPAGRQRVAAGHGQGCDGASSRATPRARPADSGAQSAPAGSARHRQDQASQRLATIPGVGFISATALAASATDPVAFRSGREFSASLGLVPLQNSSGGKDKLGRISKMGDRYLRKLLVIGATSVVRRARTTYTTAANQVRSLLERKPARPVTVAMANKTARIVWAVLARGETCRSPLSPSENNRGALTRPHRTARATIALLMTI
jgi:hypothetical protein